MREVQQQQQRSHQIEPVPRPVELHALESQLQKTEARQYREDVPAATMGV